MRPALPIRLAAMRLSIDPDITNKRTKATLSSGAEELNKPDITTAKLAKNSATLAAPVIVLLFTRASLLRLR